MAAKKNKNNNVTGGISGVSAKATQKAGSQARSRASKMGTPVGPTVVSGYNWEKSASGPRTAVTAKTTVYSRGGTGKGTTGKRSVVTESKNMRKGLPDTNRSTTMSRKLNQPKKKK